LYRSGPGTGNSFSAAVFRNQVIFLGDSREAVTRQGRLYMEKVLGPKLPELEETLSVHKQDDQFAGALIYSFLADLCKHGGKDVEILEPREFDRARKDEDNTATGR
jgi:hypothetical protein